MTPPLQALAVAAAAVVLGAGYLAFSGAVPDPLTFHDRASPEGFRELMVEGASSGFDPILGLQEAPASRTGRPERRDAAATCQALFRDPGSPATGKPDSPVQIAVFTDYRCPYCRTLSGILSDLSSGDIRIVYKEWPILSDSSVLAARAALAAARQDKYLAIHTRLMNSRLIPTMAYVEELASEFGIDKTRWREDMKAEATARALERTAALASELGFTGTPVLVVGRTIARGAITRAQIERLIADESKSPKLC